MASQSPPQPPQTKWRLHNQQRLLIAYNGLRSNCPEGIYLSLTSGDPTLWSGILFVRKGPYAPAVLRFQVTFPDNYPDRPPLIVFKSDIFHPLVTPLTTYTAGAGSSTAASTDSNVRELLPPGGFSLRHMLPHSSLKSDSSEPNVETARSSMDPLSASHLTVDPYQVLGALSLTTSKTRHESLYEVLAYMKSSFEDESVLDALPLSAAGNSGAWHAWQAHRRQTASSENRDTLMSTRSSPGRGSKTSTEWNWDGVWLGRVKKGVDASISESVLYGTCEGDDDVIHFLDLDDDTIRAIKTNIVGRG